MDTSNSLSMFGTILGTAVGWYFGGPMGGAVGGALLGGLFGSIGSSDEQRKLQHKLWEQQKKQAEILRAKVKADNESLYSAATSSTALKSGAMGAIY